MEPNNPTQLPNSEQPVQQKSFLLPVMGVILLVAFVGAGAYYLVVKKNQTETLTQKPTSMPIVTPIVSQTTLPDETANWQTYNDQTLGVSVKYPPNLIIKKLEKAVAFSFEPYPTGDSQQPLDFITISLAENYKLVPFNALFKANQGDDVSEAHDAVDVKVTKIKNLKFGRYDAVEYIRDGLIPHTSGLGRGFIGYEHYILIKKNDNEFIDIANKTMSVEKTKQRDTIFNKMISSLSIR